MWVSHIQMPPTKNHSTFMKMLRQPGCDGFHFTFVHNTLVFADGIAISDTSIYGEHHHIETVGNFSDVL